MLREHELIWPALLAVGLVAAACTDQTGVTTARPRPRFWGGVEECTAGKWTGGGRMDPPNPDVPDGATGTSTLPGKVTFGFNVFIGSDPITGACFVNKGEIEVNHHPSQTSWHVSVHDGTDEFGEPVFVEVISPDASGRGVCIVVGVNPVTARVDGNKGTDQVQMELCDNDPGAPQNSRTDAMRWISQGHGDTDLTYLTGGNIVDHS